MTHLLIFINIQQKVIQYDRAKCNLYKHTVRHTIRHKRRIQKKNRIANGDNQRPVENREITNLAEKIAERESINQLNRTSATGSESTIKNRTKVRSVFKKF